jgi:Uri superfamily endonuclease
VNGLRLTPAPGTYALLLERRNGGELLIGKWGWNSFPPGWYVYIGSALGPGGLRARVGHHLGPAARPHWHIDYLRREAVVRAVWYIPGGERREHAWARALGSAWRNGAAVEGFGCSDCDCRAHLFRAATRPSRAAFERALREAEPGHLRLRVLNVSPAGPSRRATETRSPEC